LDSGELAIAIEGEPTLVPYLVLELLHGESLADLLEREGRLAVIEAVDLLIPVLAALAAAHSRKVVHRDIKPHNVLLETAPDGHLLPKVLDFGIAKLADHSASSLSEEDMVLGTPEYVAPEQIKGDPDVDARADQFSAGAVLYHALTGRPLYEADSLVDLLRLAALARYPSLAQVRPDLPRGIQAALMRALAAERDERFDSVAAFGAALLPFASARVSDTYIDELRAHEQRRGG
jgi:eukaryotic-like serine/threonine-protein kinase